MWAVRGGIVGRSPHHKIQVFPRILLQVLHSQGQFPRRSDGWSLVDEVFHCNFPWPSYAVSANHPIRWWLAKGPIDALDHLTSQGGPPAKLFQGVVGPPSRMELFVIADYRPDYVV